MVTLRFRLHWLLLAIFVFVAPAGCSGLDVLTWDKEKFPQAEPGNPVTEILCIWKAAEGRGLDGLPTRGFAGQILFFTRKHAQPSKVTGDARVYLFDDQGPHEEQTKPIHQFDFPAEAWNSHFVVTNLGPTYQIFIPYTRTGYHQAGCALRVRIKQQDGPVAYSDTVQVKLEGSPSDSGTTAQRKQQPHKKTLNVKTAGHIVNEQLKQTTESAGPTTQSSGNAGEQTIAEMSAEDIFSALTEERPKTTVSRSMTSSPTEETTSHQSADDRLKRIEDALAALTQREASSGRTGSSESNVAQEQAPSRTFGDRATAWTADHDDEPLHDGRQIREAKKHGARPRRRLQRHPLADFTLEREPERETSVPSHDMPSNSHPLLGDEDSENQEPENPFLAEQVNMSGE